MNRVLSSFLILSIAIKKFLTTLANSKKKTDKQTLLNLIPPSLARELMKSKLKYQNTGNLG